MYLESFLSIIRKFYLSRTESILNRGVRGSPCLPEWNKLKESIDQLHEAMLMQLDDRFFEVGHWGRRRAIP